LVNAQDRRGWTCLHWAKTPAIAQLLLDELGAKDNIKNHKGQTPEQMHYKRAASSGGERAAITRLLAGWLAACVGGVDCVGGGDCVGGVDCVGAYRCGRLLSCSAPGD
jgi:hypothetical protein